MIVLKFLFFLPVWYRCCFLVWCAIGDYCSKPTTDMPGAVKTLVKYDNNMTGGWYPTHVIYTCNGGLGPSQESKCIREEINGSVNWIPPINELLPLNCSASNYTANGNDTVQSLCLLHGGYYITSRRKCVIIPFMAVRGSERYKTCKILDHHAKPLKIETINYTTYIVLLEKAIHLATVFGNPNLKGRPLVIDNGEMFDILMDVILARNRTTPNGSIEARYGPTYFTKYKHNSYNPPALQLYGYWLNGDRFYSDVDVCSTDDYCTDNILEFKGPENHTEIMGDASFVHAFYHDGVYDLWVASDGIDTKMGLIVHIEEDTDNEDSPYWNWLETVFTEAQVPDPGDRGASDFTESLPFTMPVICELLVWPPRCVGLSMSADVVLLNGSTPTLAELSVDEAMSVKCALPSAYLVADGQSYIQLKIVCSQSFLQLSKLSHKAIACAQVGCGNLTIPNGTVVGNRTRAELGFVVGEVATVVCDDGYDTEIKSSDSVMCIQDNSTENSVNITVKWNTTTPKCIQTSPCSQKDLKLPCGADRFVFTQPNGTETKDIQLSMYPHGTKVQIECHRNCPGQSTFNNPSGERECRFGKWQNCFHKCICNCSSSIIVKCQQRPMHRGWAMDASMTTEWRHYQNPAKCCYICSLHNRNNGGFITTTNTSTTIASDNPSQCRSFNLRKAPYGVQCQFFNETDAKPTYDLQIYYFDLAV